MILDRTTWGAKPPLRPLTKPRLPWKRLWLHHTAGPFGDADQMRIVQNGHQGRNWRDFAYNFGVGVSGRVHEGIGLHDHLNSDSGHSGTIVLLGNLDTHPLPPAMLEGTAWLVAHGLLAGWWLDEARDEPHFTGGHRDIPGQRTACPGRFAHAAIPAINARAAQIIRTMKGQAEMNDLERALLTEVHEALVERRWRDVQKRTGTKVHDHATAIQGTNHEVGLLRSQVSTLAGQVGQVRTIAMQAATPAEVAGIIDASLGALVDALEGMPDPTTGQPVTAETIRRLLIQLLSDGE